MIRKATDEEMHVLRHEAGVPVSVLAEMLKTSRGHIYNCLKRYSDPDGYKAKEALYNLNRKKII